MHRALLLLAVVGLSPLRSGAQTPDAVPGDTLRPLIGLRDRTPVRLSPLVLPSALGGGWRPWSARSDASRRAAEREALRAAEADGERAMAQARLLRRLGLGPEAEATADRGLFGLSRQQAEFSVTGDLFVEIASSRQRNLACTPLLLQDPLSGCRGGFSAPRIDNTLNLALSGTIGQRLYVTANLETARDFGNNNVVRVRYQGLEDEVLKSVEVGTVTFAPPPSRWLTAAIPSNNFGVNAAMQFGPLELKAIAATQKGSVVNTRTWTFGGEVTQPQDRNVRDLDYEARRFYWTVDPSTLPGYPQLDILTADAIAVPAEQRPTEVRVYRYVPATATATNFAGITASGVNGSERVGPFRWQMLVLGKDYWVDPSGLWFVLQAGIDPGDFLAVSYRRGDGTLVGTFPSTDDPTRNDQLLLIAAPNRGPSSPTFIHGMRQVYRVAGRDLARGSLRVGLTVSRSERPDSGDGTYLSLLGLAVPTDPARFDVDNRLFPRLRDPGADQVLRDVFVVLPHARPFADATRLTAAVRNDSLYRTPEYLLFSQGPPARFVFRLQYDAKAGENTSQLRLDALQMREGSEVIRADGARLVRGVDYSIDYGTARVTFLNPGTLFGDRQVTVTASFEERGFFAVAPTSLAGLAATWSFGRTGSVSAIGIYQSEATAFNRPPVGFEPTASLLGGVTADLRFELPVVSRLLNRWISRPTAARSELSLLGELAFSRPDPNRSGEAYLEEFEDDGAIDVTLSEMAWIAGSRPTRTTALDALGLGAAFELADAVQLVWQNLIPAGNGRVIELAPQDIDTTIRTTSNRIRAIEPVLWLGFHPDTSGGILNRSAKAAWTQPRRDGRPRWRTITTALSTTGMDLTRSEALEFWLYERGDRPIAPSALHLVLDLGQVSEDAIALAPERFTVTGNDTVYAGRQYVGLGRLNTERTALGTWNGRTDDLGILADRPDTLFGPGDVVLERFALCAQRLGENVITYPWADLGARCSNGNGATDEEDLDRDLLLDGEGSDDRVLRYVVDLRDPKYVVRDHAVTNLPGGPGKWKLYRIPLRTPDATIGTPDLRLVRQLRIGFVTPPDDGTPDPLVQLAMARMRFTGAPWVRRADRPIASLAGAIAEPRGEVVAASVSTQDATNLGYTSPPGVRNGASTINQGAQQATQLINEKSLRLIAKDLRSGERAEAYNRLPSGAQTLLAYREMRIWFRGRGPGWDDGRLEAFVKVGSDADNFYLFRAPARTTGWDPEGVIELERWRTLRTEIESAWLRGDPPSGAATCGGDPQAYVACDGPYLVHILNPQVNPPNLAAIQEVSTGFRYRGNGTPIAETELWIDDIRLGRPVSEVGVAGALSARLVAADVATIDLAYSHQDGRFRQIGQVPSYRTTGTFNAFATVQLDRFLPASLGIGVPFSFSLASGRVDPQLLTGSDVRGGPLTGLRRPRDGRTEWSIGLRRTARSAAPGPVRLLIDPLSVLATGFGATNVTELSDVRSSLWSVTANYLLTGQPKRRAMGLGPVVGGLPRWLRESEAGQGIARATVTPWPSTVRFSSNLSRSVNDVTSFFVPIERLADTILRPVTSIQHLWRNTAGLSWQPVGMLSAGVDWNSTRDLRHYPDSTSLGRIAAGERRRFAGMDAGVERDRSLTSFVTLSPRLASWLRPTFQTTSNFMLSRSLTTRNPVRVLGDTAGAYILPQTLNGTRSVDLGLAIDPVMLSRRIFGDSSWIARGLDRVRPVELSRRRILQSTFDLATVDADLRYQLGLGGRDAFLTRGADRAIGGLDATETSARVVVDLPVGLQANASLTTSDYDRYQRAGALFLVTVTEARQPEAGVTFSRTFTGGPIRILTTGIQLREQLANSETPAVEGGAPARYRTFTTTSNPSVSLVLANLMSLQAEYSSDRRETSGIGNTTHDRNDRITGRFEWSVPLPASLSRLRRPLAARMDATRVSSTGCVQRDEEATCVPYSDIRQFELKGSFSADLRASIRGGLTVGYTLNDLRHLQRKSATIALSAWFRIPLTDLGN